MKSGIHLSHSQVHFLNQLLFLIQNTVSFIYDDAKKVNELRTLLQDYLDEDLNESSEDESLDSHDERSENFLYPEDLSDIEKFSVTDENDKKRFFKFETNDDGELEVHLDNGKEILANVESVRRTSGDVEILSDGRWEFFRCKKFPKSMTSLLTRGVKFQIEDQS